MAEHEQVVDPIPFPAAFAEGGDAAAQSQAVILLLLGAYLAHPEAESTEFALDNELLSENDRSRLGVPPQLEELLNSRGTRFSMEYVRRQIPSSIQFLADYEIVSEQRTGDIQPLLLELAERLVREPSALAAASLCEVALLHPDELVRVAAASSYAEISLREEWERLIRVLAHGVRSDDPLVRDIAATALARIAPGHPLLADLVLPSSPISGGEASHTALIVHGTFARHADWWQPGFPGNFHQYLQTKVDPSLYSAADRFDWSGFYSDHARDLAALELVGWVKQRRLDGLDLFTHSHGGSVAMQANRVGGLRIGRLVLLSCPVHWKKYSPDFSRLSKAVSIRVHMDLVILADRGGQRFPAGAIPEVVLPIWFKHSISHEPPTWVKYKLPTKI